MGAYPHILAARLFPALDILAVAEGGFIERGLVVAHRMRRAKKMSARRHFLIGILSKGILRHIQPLTQNLLIASQTVRIHHQLFKPGAQPSFQPAACRTKLAPAIIVECIESADS